MSKVLIFSDIHIHAHKKSQDRLEDCLKVLDWVFKTAKEKNIKDVIFLGDLFHDRQTIDILSYNKTFDIFEKYQRTESPLNIYLLLGNHDLWYYERLDVSSVAPFKNIPNTHVINEPCTINISCFPVSFLPFTHDPIEQLKKINNNSNYKILMAHIAIHGAMLNPHAGTVAEIKVENDNDMTLVDANQFKQWDQVFVGHYHAEQVIDGFIEYVGSPLQLDFSEVFQEKHVIVYDMKSHNKEYIINDFSPKHFIIKDTDKIKPDINNNFIIVETSLNSADPKLMEMRDSIAGEKPKTLQIQVKKKEIKEDQEGMEKFKINLSRVDSMISSYLEHVSKKEGFDYDTDELMKIGLEICNAVNMEKNA